MEAAAPNSLLPRSSSWEPSCGHKQEEILQYSEKDQLCMLRESQPHSSQAQWVPFEKVLGQYRA